MRELARTAERLRIVREAQQRFLALWAVDCLLEEPRAFQKVAADLGPCPDARDRDDAALAAERWDFDEGQ